jgi:hypothetical protein
MDETALRRTLRALAEEEASVETPPQIEATLMARFDEYRRTPPVLRRRTRTFVRGAAAMAAGVVLFGGAVLRREIAPVHVDPPLRPTMAVDAGYVPAPPTSDARAAALAVNRVAASRPSEPRSTLVLVGGPMASGELVQVVRMRVERSALSALGITQSGSADTVEVDVLVGEDGVARGLRLPL